MKLKDARLCANGECEEVYEASGLYGKCPSCGEESFALISRWIPTVAQFSRWVDERKTTEVGGDVPASSARTKIA